MNLNRRFAVGLAAFFVLIFSIGIPFTAFAQEKVVRMGHQKVGAFTLLKASGMLEEKLKPLGYTVTWTESGGPQLLEGLSTQYCSDK